MRTVPSRGATSGSSQSSMRTGEGAELARDLLDEPTVETARLVARRVRLVKPNSDPGTPNGSIRLRFMVDTPPATPTLRAVQAPAARSKAEFNPRGTGRRQRLPKCRTCALGLRFGPYSTRRLL